MSFFRRFERVCGDVRQLPFANNSVDIAVSNLMLQWCDDLDAAFREVRRGAEARRSLHLHDIWPGHVARTAWCLGGGG